MNSGYQALHESAAWIDLSGRGEIQVTGEDRKRLVHAMTTNHVEALTPGAGCYAYFLSAQGRILADVNVLCRPESLLLDTEPDTREKVFQHLDRYIIADDVTLQDDTDSTATIAVEGPRSAELLEHLGVPQLQQDYANTEWNSALVARISLAGAGGVLIFVPSGGKQQTIEQLESAGVVPADAAAFETVRIENGKPRYGRDLSERFLAQEANQPQALSFNKGCYLGQEIVERVRSRGQIHRVLMPLDIEGTAVPEPGAKLRDEAGSVAEITSAAFSPINGKVAAIAYVRSDKAKSGTEIAAGDLLLRVR